MNRRMLSRSAAIIFAAIILVTPGAAQKAPRHNDLIYVGTYAGNETKDIYAFHYGVDSGKTTPLDFPTKTPNPTFLAVHPSLRFIYASNEISDFDPAGSGAASAFSIDRATGKLTLLNQVSARGEGHISSPWTDRVRMFWSPTTTEVALPSYPWPRTAACPRHRRSSNIPFRVRTLHPRRARMRIRSSFQPPNVMRSRPTSAWFKFWFVASMQGGIGSRQTIHPVRMLGQHGARATWRFIPAVALFI
ncbi:MAG: beta-propeller fold lactonase family protein [Acidobacteria bacterium]|nr:beta-propeller fold lactonase family protein [Acidobacteriota bacterium]